MKMLHQIKLTSCISLMVNDQTLKKSFEKLFFNKKKKTLPFSKHPPFFLSDFFIIISFFSLVIFIN